MELWKSSENADNKISTVYSPESHILIIEPLYGGSHKQFIDTLLEGLKNCKISLYVLPDKKWHWRARTSALYFYDAVPRDVQFDVIFASSVLNLAEFIALRPDLTRCRKILYFHENQLVYPIQHVKERDFQYGYNQILSWEHDKDPEKLFQVASALKRLECTFVLSVVGKAGDNESIFKEAAKELSGYIRTWGYLPSKEDFFTLLQECHVAISTAKHEFFGISMLEAVSCGCFPLCPNSLVYPEIFPEECLYKNEGELLKKLKMFCHKPHKAVEMRCKMNIDLNKFSAIKLIPKYKELLVGQ
ncbi:Glycosyltransferase-like domain-containing protein 1 [Gryllus bimaculatus]|nr:Glycosyltransferase-like domain-containing protein 1 [Gryllus bimaculatus]